MKAAFYGMSCKDWLTGDDVCLEEFSPPDKTHFALEIELYVKHGDANNSVNMFYLDVITPQSAELFFSKYFDMFPQEMTWIKGVIVTNGEFNSDIIKESILEYIDSCNMRSVPETVIMLGRFLDNEDESQFGSKKYYATLFNQISKR